MSKLVQAIADCNGHHRTCTEHLSLVELSFRCPLGFSFYTFGFKIFIVVLPPTGEAVGISAPEANCL